VDCFLVADDLTGACDAAVYFAMCGRPVAVPLTPGVEPPGANVIAVSTASRDLEPPAMRQAIRQAAAQLAGRAPRILFKKIDSTLRGRAGLEIAECLDAFSCDAAVVCPAFPRLQRIVRAGHLSVAGRPEFAPIEILAYLRRQGVERCLHSGPDRIADAIAAGARLIVLDAVCDDDLDRIAAQALALGRRLLWAGSGGLAAALARTLPPMPPAPVQPARNRPVLFCIGSDHPVTMAQQAALLTQRRPALLHIPRGEITEQQLRESIARAAPGPLLVSGGDTASLVCRAVRARHLDLVQEIVPGIPWGVIRGGDCDGWPLATKSGGFGSEDALIQVADYFA
jgi:uncharacterized protein YgbK (DUF1537 family)